MCVETQTGKHRVDEKWKKKERKKLKGMSTAPGTPRQLPIRVGIRSSTDQWLSAVEQLVCSTDQSLSDVKEPAFLNGPMVKQYL